MPVGANENQIFDVGIVALLCSVNRIVESRGALLWHFQPDGGRLSGFNTALRFLKWQVTVRVQLFSRLRSGAIHNSLFDGAIVALFFRSEVVIRLAFADESESCGAM